MKFVPAQRRIIFLLQIDLSPTDSDSPGSLHQAGLIVCKGIKRFDLIDILLTFHDPQQVVSFDILQNIFTFQLYKIEFDRIRGFRRKMAILKQASALSSVMAPDE